MFSHYTLPIVHYMQGINQREMIYADVHVVTAESCKFEAILDDDRIEYAKLNHGIKTTSKMIAPPTR